MRKPVSTSIIDPAVSPSRSPHSLGRILYADDLRELREVMRIIVEAEGYQIETACDGDEALRRLSETPAAFDLLITDHHMPHVNGLEVVRRLPTTGFHGRVLVFSSELDPSVRREYEALGVTVILPKPVRPEILRRSLAELLPARPA